MFIYLFLCLCVFSCRSGCLHLEAPARKQAQIQNLGRAASKSALQNRPSSTSLNLFHVFLRESITHTLGLTYFYCKYKMFTSASNKLAHTTHGRAPTHTSLISLFVCFCAPQVKVTARQRARPTRERSTVYTHAS